MELHVVLLALAASAAAGFATLALAAGLLSHEIAVGERLAGLSPTSPAVTPTRWATLPSLDRAIRTLLSLPLRLDRLGAAPAATRSETFRVAFLVGAAAAGAIGATALDGPLLAGVTLGAMAGYLFPLVVLRWRAARRGRRIEGQLVELCEVMASMLTAGFGYMQALREASTQVGGPLGEEVARFLDSVSLGADFEDALVELRDRLQSDDFEVVATALEVQRRTGGNLAEILGGVALTIRDRQTFHRELRALTSRERFSAVIVAVFPLALICVLTAIMPEVFGRLFTDPTGRMVLVIAFVFDALGYLVARRVATLEV